MKKIFQYFIQDSKRIIPYAIVSGGIFGYGYKLQQEKMIRQQEFLEMQEFKEELNVNAIKGLKQDADYIKLVDLNDKITLYDQHYNVLATQRDLGTGLSFLIVGNLNDNIFLTKYYKLKQFLEKQKAHHTERISQYVKETGNNQVDSATMDLIQYKVYPIAKMTSEVQLKGKEQFYFVDEDTYKNFLSVFQQNESYIIGEQKSVGLRLDLTLTFEDLQQQIVGFSILQAAYIMRRDQYIKQQEQQNNQQS